MRRKIWEFGVTLYFPHLISKSLSSQSLSLFSFAVLTLYRDGVFSAPQTASIQLSERKIQVQKSTPFHENGSHRQIWVPRQECFKHGDPTFGFEDFQICGEGDDSRQPFGGVGSRAVFVWKYRALLNHVDGRNPHKPCWHGKSQIIYRDLYVSTGASTFLPSNIANPF